MKLNKLYIAVFMAALFVGCDDYEDSVVQSPAVAVGNPAVRFTSDTPTAFELDPNVSLQFELNLIRDNATEALEAPISVITNTEDSFVFPAVVTFAAGENTASIIVNMLDDAPKGRALSFEITFGDDFTNPYKVEYSTCIADVSIIKWNVLGTAQFYDSFSFYTVAEVTLEQRDDIPAMYRINSPYTDAILLDAEWDGWLGGSNQDYITFTVDDEDNITWNDFWYTGLLYQGNSGQDVKAYEPAALEKEVETPSVVQKDGDDVILYFDLHPSIYIDGLGGYGEKDVYLGFPGFDLSGALGVPVFVN